MGQRFVAATHESGAYRSLGGGCGCGPLDYPDPPPSSLGNGCVDHRLRPPGKPLIFDRPREARRRPHRLLMESVGTDKRLRKAEDLVGAIEFPDCSAWSVASGIRSRSGHGEQTAGLLRFKRARFRGMTRHGLEILQKVFTLQSTRPCTDEPDDAALAMTECARRRSRLGLSPESVSKCRG